MLGVKTRTELGIIGHMGLDTYCRIYGDDTATLCLFNSQL